MSSIHSDGIVENDKKTFLYELDIYKVKCIN